MMRPPRLGREGHARRSPPMLVADLHREAARRGGTWTRCRSPSGRTRCSRSSARRRPGAPPLVWPSSCLASAPWARAGGTLFDSRAPRAGPLLREAGGHIDRPQGGGVQDRRHADARRRDREARPCDRRADQLASLDG